MHGFGFESMVSCAKIICNTQRDRKSKLHTPAAHIIAFLTPISEIDKLTQFDRIDVTMTMTTMTTMMKMFMLRIQVESVFCGDAIRFY